MKTRKGSCIRKRRELQMEEKEIKEIARESEKENK